ncbi:hypothetical protein Baya_11979 [Bagarius yarrelli]|uniref:Uncharacterized protein n=1 Tax=Bagarius yarrelli TaxID=175774 RepID=A0A556V1J3_BAGYA|nr:hypothetical protein Baya_11979 [Bagarius yarrelli]
MDMEWNGTELWIVLMADVLLALQIEEVCKRLKEHLHHRVNTEGEQNCQSQSRQGGSRRMRYAMMDSAWVTTLKNKQINSPEPCHKAPPTSAISQNDRHLLTLP